VRRIALVLASVVAILALGACSSGKKSGGSTTSTTTSTSSLPDASTTTTGASSTTSSAPATTTTKPETSTTINHGGGPRISSFTSSPPAPVACNSPTMVELKWMAILASSVDLSIDGTHAATFGGGAQDHLEYFACDGRPHVYMLLAHAGAASASAKLVLTSKRR
jgi:hypothetical protein